MYIFGRKVMAIKIKGDYNIYNDCHICQDNGTYSTRISYDHSWDDVEPEPIQLCPKCLIDDGWFMDDEDLKENLR